MYIDLSVPLNVQTPVYPGDPHVKIEPAGALEADGWLDHVVTAPTHVGTHIDSPAHMLAGGKTLGAYPLERFAGRGRYVDVRAGFDLTAIRKLGIARGDIVLLHTGMSAHYHDSAYYKNSPHIPEDVARYLVEQGVSVVGMDMNGPDEHPFPIHRLLLGGDVLIVENLTGLEALAGKAFNVYAWPVRLDLDGAPVRVVAYIHD
ncbi:MAG TPA: cyclase family protein [Candidatus Saccharimonadia bacterium]|nr:cyclase family protein [Candidatus Saccharimonadia bacterium]